MILQNKSVWRCILFLQGAPGKIKCTVASSAVKVVVMPLSGAFVKRAKNGMINPLQPAVIDKDF